MTRTLALALLPMPRLSLPSPRPVLTAFAVWQERRRLATLDSHQLRDLGLSAQDAWTEARRPIWDLPR